MISATNDRSAIIRTERGLTIAGTRITLYDVMDFLKANYPAKLIRDKFNLTDEQINAAFSYLKANQDEVEAEYREVLRTRKEIRKYWEKRNREHFARIATLPRNPGKESLWKKLEEQKAERISGKP